MSTNDPSTQDPPEDLPEQELHGLDPGELLARGLNTVKPSGGPGNWVPPTPEDLARLLPQYEIESLLGAGGMGAVYKGMQHDLERPVAIKIMAAELSTDPQFVGRFKREARTLAKLHHPAIVAIHDFGQTSEGHLYFVMEYVDGTDLRHVLKSTGLTPDQALEVTSQICDALQYAHQRGVIHRDIKPANILLTSEGYIKLADFGLSRPVQEEDTGGLTMTNMAMGTPDYMSPEQRTGHVDHRTDIYALGVTLYEMLTGNRPHGAFVPPSRKVQVDVRIDEVVLKALQEEPERRYSQVSELKTDLDIIRSTLPPPIVPATPAEPLRPRLLVPALILFVALAAIAGLLLLINRGHREAATSGMTPVEKTGTAELSAASTAPLAKSTEGPKEESVPVTTAQSKPAVPEQAPTGPSAVRSASPPISTTGSTVTGASIPVVQATPGTEVLMPPLSTQKFPSTGNIPPPPDAIDYARISDADAKWRVNGSLRFGFLGAYSAAPMPKGTDFDGKPSGNVNGGSQSQDPCDLLNARSVTFNMNVLWTHRVVFKVESESTLSRVIIQSRCALSPSTWIEVHDLTGKLVTSSGPYTCGTLLAKIELPIPALKAFYLTFRTNDPTMYLAAISFEKGAMMGEFGEAGPLRLPGGAMLTCKYIPAEGTMCYQKGFNIVGCEMTSSYPEQVIYGKCIFFGNLHKNAYPSFTYEVKASRSLDKLVIGTPMYTQSTVQVYDSTQQKIVSARLTSNGEKVIPLPNLSHFYVKVLVAGRWFAITEMRFEEAVVSGASQDETPAPANSKTVATAATTAVIRSPSPAATPAPAAPSAAVSKIDFGDAPEPGKSYHASEGINMVWIAPGSFQMGDSTGDGGDDEKPVHEVRLATGYWLGESDVTQAQWQAVMGNNPSNFKGGSLPVESVSWYDAVAFCRKFTASERARGHLPAGIEYRLPTEAQWEYACRAGTTGDYAGDLDAMAWYGSNSENTTHEVKTKSPNAWGLYDMHGNVWQWCSDWYGNYSSGSQVDPAGPDSGAKRVFRGGSWADFDRRCRTAIRRGRTPGNSDRNLGFRLAAVPSIGSGAMAGTGTGVAVTGPGVAPARDERTEKIYFGDAPEPGKSYHASEGINMVWIAPGSFQMGDSTGHGGDDEKPVHEVRLATGYWLGESDVTQAQWQAVMGNNPSNFKGGSLPVEHVSWYDAVAFCRKFTGSERARGHLPAGIEYRLPTEAQWEYACRAGTTGDYAGDLDAMAWYGSNSENTTHEVKTKSPNAWGLYDMHGNVWQWCSDWYGNYSSGSQVDPAGPDSGANRVFRGGAWYMSGGRCRSASRYRDAPGCRYLNCRYLNLGFRLAAVPSSGSGAMVGSPTAATSALSAPGIAPGEKKPDPQTGVSSETTTKAESSPLAANSPPPDTPTPTPDLMAWALEDKDHWPKEVKLTQPISFPVLLNSRAAGSIMAPAGTVAKVINLQRDQVTVEWLKNAKIVSIDATDLIERVSGEITGAPIPATSSTEKAQVQQYYWSNFVGMPGAIAEERDGEGSAARFANPSGVALDGNGNLYVADRDRNTIRKVTPGGVVTTLAGAGRNADGIGSAAQFAQPGGVAVDGSGNVYVADCYNHAIRKVTPGGVVTALAGSPGVRGPPTEQEAPPGFKSRRGWLWTRVATFMSLTIATTRSERSRWMEK